MPLLSIIIPAVRDSASLERSLLSVLENRPHDCEIIVVNACGYQDPYQLTDEVRFLAAAGSRLVDCINLALAESRGAVVHLLESGAVVEAGWTEAAVAHFADPRVASVAPLQISETCVVSAGIEYHPGGATLYRGRGTPCAEWPQVVESVLGCSLAAAFHRRAALVQVGGLDAALDEETADAELALRIRAAGWRAVCEPSACVHSDEAQPGRPGLWAEFQRARRSERLFWRAAPLVGWTGALLWHPLVATQHALRPSGGGRALTRLAGRLLSCFEWGETIGYHRRVSQLKQSARAAAASGNAGILRADPAHSGGAGQHDASSHRRAA